MVLVLNGALTDPLRSCLSWQRSTSVSKRLLGGTLMDFLGICCVRFLFHSFPRLKGTWCTVMTINHNQSASPELVKMHRNCMAPFASFCHFARPRVVGTYGVNMFKQRAVHEQYCRLNVHDPTETVLISRQYRWSRFLSAFVLGMSVKQGASGCSAVCVVGQVLFSSC